MATPVVWKRLRALGEKRRWPGWAMSLVGLLKTVDQWDERIRVAYDISRELGGDPEMISAFLRSPWLGPSMIAAGMIYVVFIGEPTVGVQRHPRWQIVGWSVFGICLTLLTLMFGYVLVEAHVATELADREIRFQVWHMDVKQKDTLGKLLDAIPDNQRFSILIEASISSNLARSYANDLGSVFTDHHWQVSGSSTTMLNPAFFGVAIGVPEGTKSVDGISGIARQIGSIFSRAGIHFQYGPTTERAVSAGARQAHAPGCRLSRVPWTRHRFRLPRRPVICSN